jgi:hypothetical protein
VVFDVDAQLWARSRVIVAELVKAPRFITTVPEGAVGLDASLSRAAAEARLSETVVAYQGLHDAHLQLEARHRDCQARYFSLEDNYRAILGSTSWRITWPLRVLLGRSPITARLLRRAATLAWWTITLQLRARLHQNLDASSR